MHFSPSIPRFWGSLNFFPSSILYFCLSSMSSGYLCPHPPPFPLHFFTPHRFIHLFSLSTLHQLNIFFFFPRFFRQSDEGDEMLVSNLTSPCNTGCGCPTTYDPVCGTNGVLYYSACFAGCLETGEINGVEKVCKVLFS